jgi:hypothetical protein
MYIFKEFLYKMMKLFFILALLSGPIICLYGTGNGYNEDSTTKSLFGKFSIANLGMDSVRCTSQRLGLEKIELFCPYG